MLEASRNLPRKSFRIVCIFTSLLFILAQESCITLYTGRYTIIETLESYQNLRYIIKHVKFNLAVWRVFLKK